MKLVTIRKPWGYEELVVLDGAVLRLVDLRMWLTEIGLRDLILDFVPYPRLVGVDVADPLAPSVIFAGST